MCILTLKIPVASTFESLYHGPNISFGFTNLLDAIQTDKRIQTTYLSHIEQTIDEYGHTIVQIFRLHFQSAISILLSMP